MLSVFISRLASRLAEQQRRLARNDAGLAALEFALVAPVMVAMLLGMSELTVGVNTDRKLALASRTMADLTGRATSTTTSDMAAVFTAGSIVMQPYSSAAAKFVVSSILVTTSGTTTTGTVGWSCANATGVAKRTVGSTYPVPASFKTASSFILVEATMAYTPMFGGQFTGGIMNLNETIPWPVRNGAQVTWSGTAC